MAYCSSEDLWSCLRQSLISLVVQFENEFVEGVILGPTTCVASCLVEHLTCGVAWNFSDECQETFDEGIAHTKCVMKTQQHSVGSKTVVLARTSVDSVERGIGLRQGGAPHERRFGEVPSRLGCAGCAWSFLGAEADAILKELGVTCKTIDTWSSFHVCWQRQSNGRKRCRGQISTASGSSQGWVTRARMTGLVLDTNFAKAANTEEIDDMAKLNVWSYTTVQEAQRESVRRAREFRCAALLLDKDRPSSCTQQHCTKRWKAIVTCHK